MSFIDRNIQNSNSGDDGSYDFNNCCGDIGISITILVLYIYPASILVFYQHSN